MSHPVVRRLRTLDAKLVKAGFPAITDWWWSTIDRFYDSGRKQAVVRCGRRAGKSTTWSRVAVAEALSDGHTIPPGDVGVVAIVSVSRGEAAERVRLVKAILDALGVKYRPIEGGIELVDRPIVFRVYTASIAGVSGFTCIFAFCDEVAKWKDADSGANPATEVLASLRPTLAGNLNAKIVLSSSPMGLTDAHALAYDKGETDFQVVAGAETWVARPTLTEAECRTLEEDEETFWREYGIRPFNGSAASILGQRDLLACTREGELVVPPQPRVTYVAAMDPATRSNGWTLVIARAITESGVTRVQVVLAREWRASRGGALDSDATLGEIAGVITPYGVDYVATDQWSFDALDALARHHGFRLDLEVASQTSKVQMFDALRRRVVDRTIELPPDPVIRADLLGVRKWISRNGAFSIELERQGGRHSDFAPSVALATAIAAAAEAAMPAWATPEGLAGMQAFLGGPAAENYAPDADFGRDTRAPERVRVSRTFDGSRSDAIGLEPFFSAEMRATWTPQARTPVFTPASSPAFRDAVARWLKKYPQP